ncbi:Exocyst complex component S3A [Asimina triloba]
MYKIKHLSKVEVIPNDPSGCTFMLWAAAVCISGSRATRGSFVLRTFSFWKPNNETTGFDNLRSQSVSPPQWTMRNINDRNRILLCILNMCKEILGRLPKVVGIDIVEMALWAKENTNKVTNRASTEDGHDLSMMTPTDLKVAVEKDLVSQAEEEDMEALLGTDEAWLTFLPKILIVIPYSVDVGGVGKGLGELSAGGAGMNRPTSKRGESEAEAFSERLKRELQALEAANVHAILENEPLIDEVMQGLESATICVDDMDEWLGIFNVKLRHMREDIESEKVTWSSVVCDHKIWYRVVVCRLQKAISSGFFFFFFPIESRNNKLEMQSVNNKSLIEELDKLLERLRVPSEYAASLTGGSFDEGCMLQNIEACEWLTGALRALEVPNLDICYGNMRAVKEKRSELEKLKSTFVRRASEFLRSYFSSLVDFMISDKSYFSQRGQLKRPDHADLRYKCRTYARLLQHLKSLDKNCMGPLRKAYCSSLNLLLRREAREFANELRASTKASRNPTVWLEASTGSNQAANSDTSTVSEAYSKMLTIFIPLLVDESSFFAHFMCFDVPALVPPTSSGKSGSPDDTNDDDLSPMDLDGNDIKPSNELVLPQFPLVLVQF